jgi:hypothetical protein
VSAPVDVKALEALIAKAPGRVSTDMLTALSALRDAVEAIAAGHPECEYCKAIRARIAEKVTL